MTEYIYKGFKIFYNIKSVNADKSLYQAKGHIVGHTDENSSSLSKKFQAKYHTRLGAENSIKKQLEDYINCEWNDFHEGCRT